MVSEPDIRRCASKDAEPWVDTRWCANKDAEPWVDTARMLGLVGGWIVRSHIDWRGE